VNRVVSPYLVFRHTSEIVAWVQDLDVFAAQCSHMLLHAPFITVQLLLHIFLEEAMVPVGDVGRVCTAILVKVARHGGHPEAIFFPNCIQNRLEGF
jgi:hypothetical protein